MQLTDEAREAIIEKKKKALFIDLALIHSLSHIQQIAYFNSIKGTNFRKPKIKSKADQISKFSEDIIKSIGDAITLREDMAEYMEYEHFTELYELMKHLVFMETASIKNLTKILENEKAKNTKE